MNQISEDIQRNVDGARANFTKHNCKITVEKAGGAIKIEPNTTLRGAIYPPVKKELCNAAQSEFELSACQYVINS